MAHGFIGTIIVIVMLIDSPPPCNHGRGFPPVIALFVEKNFWFPAGYAPKNSLPSPSCAFLGAALASRRSRPRPVAGRRADISKAPEEVVPLEPNGLPPCPGMSQFQGGFFPLEFVYTKGEYHGKPPVIYQYRKTLAWHMA